MTVRTPLIDVHRAPITIQRTPIMEINRKPIVRGKLLEWDTVYSGLVNYIKFAAKDVSQQYRSSLYSAEDLFQEGMLLLYHCFELYRNKPYEEFAAIFKTSVWRKLRDLAKRRSFTTVDLEDAYDIGYSEDVVGSIYEEYRLQQVAEILKEYPVALTIFKEFVNPSQRTLWEAKMDIARKNMLKSQNYRIAVPQSIQVKSQYIQRGMEIPKVRFKEQLRIVKSVVAQVYMGNNASEDQVDDILQGYHKVA